MPPFVNIKVKGPKALIPSIYTSELECDVNWTWRDFLSTRCRIGAQHLGAGSTVVVRKARYPTVSASWEAQLGDVVKVFIKKYAKRRSLYTVRLVMKNASPRRRRPAISPNASAVVRTGDGVYRAPDSVSSIVINNVRTITAGSNEQNGSEEMVPGPVFNVPAAQRMKASSSKSRPELDLPHPPIINNLSPRFVDHDNVRSVSTEMEMRDLMKKGIQVNLIKPVVYDRLKAIDNAEMLRIQHELQTLVKDSAWPRLICRIPRATHLLSNLFVIHTQ